jgi:hypothetical protein
MGTMQMVLIYSYCQGITSSRLIARKLESDVEWIMERCPKLNSLSILEPTAQALAIMFAINNSAPFTEKENWGGINIAYLF